MATQMNSAISQASLMMPQAGVPIKTRTKFQIAKRVFQLAASGGFPYTGMSYKDWAKKWLTSEVFRLMEIDINAAASPHLPKNPERVAFRLLCSTDSMDPIVVDLNKQKTGKSHLGYIPKIVVLDGKHRKQAQMLQGHTRILAWVGCKAEKGLSNVKVIDKIDFRNVKPVYVQPSPANVSYVMHCATIPATGSAMLDQSGGEGGSRPRPAMVKANKQRCPKCGSSKFKLMPTDFETAKCSDCGKNFKAAGGGGAAGGMGGPGNSLGSGSGSNPAMKAKGKKTHACGCGESEVCACSKTAPFSQGQLEDASTSDEDVPKPSDQSSRVSASDRRNYLFPDPNIVAPGKKGWETEPGTLVGSNLAPFLTRSTGATNSEMSHKFRSFRQGTGTGPTLGKNTGATRSEMSRAAGKVPNVGGLSVKGSGKMVKKIFTKAPPGHEAQVLKLKKKYGEDSSTPFKIAWSQYEKEMEAKGL